MPAARRKRYHKDENNMSNMIGSGNISSNSCAEERWQHAGASCSIDFERSNERSLALAEQSTRLNHCTSGDHRQLRNGDFLDAYVGYDYNTLRKKQCLVGEVREIDRNVKRGAAVGFHRRQGSADLYTKLEPLDNRDVLPKDELLGQQFEICSGRYVATGHGLWVDFYDSYFPRVTDSSRTLSPSRPQAKLCVAEINYEQLSVSGLNAKDGISFSSGASVVGGVSGLKEWYKKRTLVTKATSKSEAAPKSKYLRQLILLSWKHDGVGAPTIFTMLSKRPFLSSPPMALKILIAMHKLIQHGSPNCLVAGYGKLPVLSNIASSFRKQCGSAVDGGYCPLICAYASMLVEKAAFHRRFRAYENNYSVDFTIINKVSHSKDSLGDHVTIDALACLQKILEEILFALEVGFVLLRSKYTTAKVSNTSQIMGAGSNVDISCRTSDQIGLVVASIIPILREADLVYDICSYLLSSLISVYSQDSGRTTGADVLKSILVKFGLQHRALRIAFEQARSESSIACAASPPSLPLDPPFPATDLNHQHTRCLLGTNCDAWERSRSSLLELSAVSEEASDIDVERARPLVPSTSKIILEGGDNSGVRAMDELWAGTTPQLPQSGNSFLRQEVSGPVVGGVGAAAAAAIQRFAAGCIW